MAIATFDLEDIEAVDAINDVDNTNKADGRVLVFRSASGNLEYEVQSGGGGGGADVKSGVATNISSHSTGTVSFTTDFAAVPAVTVSWASTSLKEIKKWIITNVTVSSFDIYYEEKQSAAVDIHWIATDAGNP